MRAILGPAVWTKRPEERTIVRGFGEKGCEDVVVMVVTGLVGVVVMNAGKKRSEGVEDLYRVGGARKKRGRQVGE